MTNGYAMKRGF